MPINIHITMGILINILRVDKQIQTSYSININMSIPIHMFIFIGIQ